MLALRRSHIPGRIAQVTGGLCNLWVRGCGKGAWKYIRAALHQTPFSLLHVHEKKTLQ
jgi:hypothetical protein